MQDGEWTEDRKPRTFWKFKKWWNQSEESIEWRTNESHSGQGKWRTKQGKHRKQHPKARRAFRIELWNLYVSLRKKVFLLLCYQIDEFINIFFVSSSRKPRRKSQKTIDRESLKRSQYNNWNLARICQIRIWLNKRYVWKKWVTFQLFIQLSTFMFTCVDDLRRSVWPLLLGVDREQCDPVPTLEELSSHPEYNQVVLDVNRSLKRFPPGIPIQQRLALQDQLTVIILRVITKYPHLSYYQVSELNSSTLFSLFLNRIVTIV